MTQKSVKQQADYEAKVSLIQMGVKQYNDTVFIAPSCTANVPHIVTVVEGQVTYCSDCKGFASWKHCQHGIAVLRFLAEEEAKIEEQARIALAEEQSRSIQAARPAKVTQYQTPGNQPASSAWLWYNDRRFNTPAGRAYLAELAAKKEVAA